MSRLKLRTSIGFIREMNEALLFVVIEWCLTEYTTPVILAPLLLTTTFQLTIKQTSSIASQNTFLYRRRTKKPCTRPKKTTRHATCDSPLKRIRLGAAPAECRLVPRPGTLRLDRKVTLTGISLGLTNLSRLHCSQAVPNQQDIIPQTVKR